jgi:DNA repair protein RadC
MTTNRYHDERDTLARYAEMAAEIAATKPNDRPRVEDPEIAAELFARVLDGASREHAMSITLDAKHRPLAVRVETVGSLDHTFMTPREMLRSAILDNAAAIILAHNHPSGDPEPSKDDERVTRRLADAARIIGVELLDHLVLGTNGSWVSMARRGLI